MQKESIFDFSGMESKIKMLKVLKRVIIGFKTNQYGEAIVTTGVPVRLNSDKVSYKDVKNETYENYMTRQLRNK